MANSKSASKSRIVILRLSKQLLSRFPSDAVASAPPSSPSSSALESNAQPATGVDTPDTSSMPAANGTNAADVSDSAQIKGVPGPKPGMKRNASQMTVEGLPKARGKPGPKKKMRVDGANGVLVPVNAPKINPKASAGAINANLRALDRTGKPCRRWHKTPFNIKSFTGSLWLAGSWGAPQRAQSSANENGDVISGDGKSEVSTTPSETAGKTASANGNLVAHGELKAPDDDGMHKGTSPLPILAS